MRITKYSILTFLLISVFCFQIKAQTRNPRYAEYINKYNSLAIEQMKLHKIPASITLAQGLLESGAGMSELARKSNNHFGIKCGSGWRGRSVKHDDDARNECFRAYRNPIDSYEDHSQFLVNGSRYAFLFKLSTTDYKGWAHGLKKAGYATDPTYAYKLIDLIESYNLHKYDKQGVYSKRQLSRKPWLLNPHPVFIANDRAYVLARSGDTFEMLAKELGISRRNLIGYNELYPEYKLQEGDILYLKAKRKKALSPYKIYIVEDGDSMYSISQRYAMKLKNLYKLNKKDPDYMPQVGDTLRLR